MTFLTNALISSLALIMLLLVFQFNSISKPIIILISIFLSFTGVFLGITLPNAFCDIDDHDGDHFTVRNCCE
jgi:multidrug efflux pump subunit AcrB